MLMLIMGGLQSCTAMFGSAGTGLAATSYLSEDSDMLGAEAAYAGWKLIYSMNLTTTKASTPAMTNTASIWTRSAMTPMC